MVLKGFPNAVTGFVLFANAILPLSGVIFFPFCFVRLSVFIESAGPSFNRSSIYIRPGSHMQLAHNCLCPFCFCLFFVSLDMSLFPSIMYSTITVCFLHGEYVVRFSPSGWCFLPCDHGLDFDMSKLCEKFNQM